MNSESTIQPEGSQTTQIDAGDQKLTGIRGWLIVVVIGFVSTIILSLYNISKISTLISRISSNAASKMIPALYFEMTGFAVSAFALILALIFMFSKKAFFPKYIITLYVMTAIFNITDILWALSLGSKPESLGLSVVQAILPCIIWCSYFTLSKRVKNTFVK